MLTRRFCFVLTDLRRVLCMLGLSALGVQADRGRPPSPRKKAEAQGLTRLTGAIERDLFNVSGSYVACK